MTWAVVLAAGRSHRMGCQKLLLPWCGAPLIAWVVDRPQESASLRGIRVVVGPGPAGERVAAVLGGPAVERVTNPDPEGDMLSSVRCGLRAWPVGALAVAVVPGDCVGVGGWLIDALSQAQVRWGWGLVVPTWQGRRGHPLLVAARYREEVLTRHDGRGLRGLFEAHPGEVGEVEVATPQILRDLDTPADYWRARARFCQSPGSCNTLPVVRNPG